MQERFKFVLEVDKGEKSVAMLCREFGISSTPISIHSHRRLHSDSRAQDLRQLHAEYGLSV